MGAMQRFQELDRSREHWALRGGVKDGPYPPFGHPPQMPLVIVVPTIPLVVGFVGNPIPRAGIWGGKG